MNRMKRGMKRLTAALLAAVVLTGTVPGNAFTLVKAEAEPVEPAAAVKAVFKGSVYEKNVEEKIPYKNAKVQIEFWKEGEEPDANPEGSWESQGTQQTDESGAYQFEQMEAAVGTKYRITVDPEKEGYQQKMVEGDLTKEGDLTEEDVLDVVNDVEVEKQKFSITTEIDSERGTCKILLDEKEMAAGEENIPYGSDCVIEVTPKEGYVVEAITNAEEKELEVEEIEESNSYVCRLNNIERNETVKIQMGEQLKYSYKFNKSGEGVVYYQIEEERNELESSIRMEKGQTITFEVIPDTGYMVKAFKIGGREITPGECRDGKDGSYTYEYVVNEHPQDKSIDTEFEEIPIKPVEFLESGLAVCLPDETELTSRIVIEGGKEILKFSSSSEIVLKQLQEGQELRRTENEEYTERLSYSGTSRVLMIYMRKSAPEVFGTEQIIKFEKEMDFIIDKEKPVINLDQDHIITNGAEDKVMISGKASDEGGSELKNMECSMQPDFSESSSVEADNEGIFQFRPDMPPEGSHTYYIRAWDHAGNVSEVKAVQVLEDETAPEVTEVSLVERNMRSYIFGNFAPSTVSLYISAKDVVPAEGVAVSGAEVIQIYDEDSKTVIAKAQVSREDHPVLISLPSDKLKKLTRIKITATDRAGNESERKGLSAFEKTGATHDSLMIENQPPAANIELSSKGLYKDKSGKYWYAKSPQISLELSDKAGTEAGSGLNQVEMYLKERKIAVYSKQYKEAVQEDRLTLSSEQLSKAGEGGNTIQVRVEDNAGNSPQAFWEKKFYVDKTAPEITKFQIVKKDGSAFHKVLNFLTFGNFFKEELQVKVTAKDSGSGLKELTLYAGKQKYTKTISGSEDTAVFSFPAEEVMDKKKRYLDAEISAAATDQVGRKTPQPVLMNTGNSNIKDSKLMIETISPTVKIQTKGCLKKGNDYYNSKDTQVTVTVSDQDSGLRETDIRINGKRIEYKNHTKKKTNKQVYTINTEKGTLSKEGYYLIEAISTDNAGNQTSREVKIYKDSSAPYISDFSFEKAGSLEGDGKASTKSMRYGYYFKDKTQAVITAADDAPSSGITSITYYTVSADGTIGKPVTKKVNGKNQITAAIPEDFKGQIYASAKDAVGNMSKNHVSPEGAVAESEKKHNSEEHIILKLPETASKDVNGRKLYGKNVEVELNAIDTFSGIRLVEWRIEAPYDTECNQSGFIEVSPEGRLQSDNGTEDWKAERERNLVTRLKKNFTVEHNSNDITLWVKITDRSGHVTEKRKKISIDKTAPVIQVSYDNNSSDGEYQEYYKESRAASIKIRERNFNPANVACEITGTGTAPVLSGWTEIPGSDPDETVYTATIVYGEDGDYQFDMNYVDNAGNEAAGAEDHFTIDKTVPVIQVSYDNQDAVNGTYFAHSRTAAITIQEHNFSPERVIVTGTMTSGGNSMAFPGISGWTESGTDLYTATVSCNEDGVYAFTVDYRDKAGNEAQQHQAEEFCIDMAEPEISIIGVAEQSANSGTVAPVISVADTNFESANVTINLTGANRGKVEAEGTYSTTANGQTFTFENFPQKPEVDDIYTLQVSMQDRAGNESQQQMSFSVNRFGSVYSLAPELKKVKGSYIQEEMNVVLTETNVDPLDHNSIRVVLNRNGEPRDLKEGTEYQIKESGGSGSWSQYQYTVNKSLFKGDGMYIVSLYSKDLAGNSNENGDETKKAEVSFGVDKTAPVIVPINIENNTQYAENEKTAVVSVEDNLVLNKVKIFLNGSEVLKEQENGNYKFAIPEQDGVQEVRIIAHDAAGNTVERQIKGILVTTNALVRWYHNTSLFAGSVAGVVGITGTTAILLVWKKKKRKIR